VLDSALRHGHGKVFAAHLTQVGSHEIGPLRLGKKTERLLDEASNLHKQLDRYAHGTPAIRFIEQEIDQARAAGVVIEFDTAAPVIVDRALYRELAKQAIKRTVEDLRAKAATRAEERKQAANRGARRPADPMRDARRERDSQLRELADQAHGANLDLGSITAHTRSATARSRSPAGCRLPRAARPAHPPACTASCHSHSPAARTRRIVRRSRQICRRSAKLCM
jgi:hypothetical protein